MQSKKLYLLAGGNEYGPSFCIILYIALCSCVDIVPITKDKLSCFLNIYIYGHEVQFKWHGDRVDKQNDMDM